MCISNGSQLDSFRVIEDIFLTFEFGFLVYLYNLFCMSKIQVSKFRKFYIPLIADKQRKCQLIFKHLDVLGKNRL